MALAWADFFAPPTGDTGLSNGTFAAVDEFPFSDADSCYFQNDVTDSFTGFDLSSSPGDKKGFRLWVRFRIQNASPTVDVTFRLLENGTTQLWSRTISAVAHTGFLTYALDIPDSAFSGDPDINNLSIEVTTLRTTTGNQRTHFSAMRLSKSPFTAAQEASLPSSIDGADYSCYLPEHLALLGAAADEAVVVWPDGSGNGRHILRHVGTGAFYRSGGYVEFTSSATRFVGSWDSENPVTGNAIWAMDIYAEDTGQAQSIVSTGTDFVGSGLSSKQLTGIDDEGAGDKALIMDGDGSGTAHLYGATTISFDTDYWFTHWVQDAGNDHLWINDDASPDIDGASGSNDLHAYSVGNRESDDRPFQGRINAGGLWAIDGAGITEANIDDARDEWVNGPGGTTFTETFTGSITPAGSTLETVGKQIAGSVSPAAAIVRALTRALTGATTPSGVATRSTTRDLAGTIATTGDLTDDVGKGFSGNVTSTGEINRASHRAVTGEIIPAGQTTRSTSQDFDGSITPSGSVTRRLARTLAGALALAGASSTILVKLLAVAGSIAPAGSITKEPQKRFVGSAVLAGDVSRGTSKILAGTVTTAANLTGHVTKILAGALTLAGNLVNVHTPAGAITIALAGSLTLAGDHLNRVSKVLIGVATPTSAVTRRTAITITATVAPLAGAVVRSVASSFSGAITPTGVVSVLKLILVALSGAISTAGSVTRSTVKRLASTITPSSTVTKHSTTSTSGSITPTGGVAKRTAKLFSAVITLAAAISTNVFQIVAAPISRVIHGSGRANPGQIHHQGGSAPISQDGTGTIPHQGRTETEI